VRHAPDELLVKLHTARANWGVELGAFEEFVRDRGPLIEESHLEDLYLAFGASQGAEGAVHELVLRVHSLALSHKRARVSEDTLDEARQVLLETLLVQRSDRSPRIATYDGRGPLEGWLRISLARTALRIHEKTKHEESWEEELLALPNQGGSPESEYLKQLYKQKYKKAFERAAAELEPRERSLLRQHLLLGMSIDRLGELYGVHRVTASRWVVSAKESLMQNMRKKLEVELGLSHAELERVGALVESRLDFSLHRVLRSTRHP
jgi:RNA polymerase sigma-70 factor, ECF subfamily